MHEIYVLDCFDLRFSYIFVKWECDKLYQIFKRSQQLHFCVKHILNLVIIFLMFLFKYFKNILNVYRYAFYKIGTGRVCFETFLHILLKENKIKYMNKLKELNIYTNS